MRGTHHLEVILAGITSGHPVGSESRKESGTEVISAGQYSLSQGLGLSGISLVIIAGNA